MASYQIVFAEPVEQHLKALTARERRIVLDGIEELLSYEPTLGTRHRKRMRPNLRAEWELRLGDIRVYYNVTDQPRRRVEILAVGMKRRNQVWIGGKRVQL